MKKTFIAIIICAWMTRGYAQLDTAQISTELSGWIKEKNLPGMVLYIKKGDQVLLHQAFGHSNKEEKIPMKVEQRFRIFSMSKPITSLALMNCLTENNLTTDHLMTDIFPSFKSEHPISIQQVMTHTAGFSYGGEFSWTGLQYWWYDPLEKSDDLGELIDRLSGLPLSYKPGEGWEYSLSHDVQGAIIEQVSKEKFPEYLQRKLLGPFHMNNTGFVYKGTDSKSLSLAPFYRYDKDAGKSVLLDDEHEYDKKIASGGGGLYSTTNDYMKFLDRLMSDSSKTKLYVNQLSEEVTKIPEGIYPNSGYGYGVAVKLSTDESYLPKGSFYWAGLGGTIFWFDPVNNIKVVAMMQMAGGRKSMEKKIIPLIYKAIQPQ